MRCCMRWLECLTCQPHQSCSSRSCSQYLTRGVYRSVKSARSVQCQCSGNSQKVRLSSEQREADRSKSPEALAPPQPPCKKSNNRQKLAQLKGNKHHKCFVIIKHEQFYSACSRLACNYAHCLPPTSNERPAHDVRSPGVRDHGGGSGKKLVGVCVCMHDRKLTHSHTNKPVQTQTSTQG